MVNHALHVEGARRTSSQSSAMMQEYLQSDATISERIAMGGRSNVIEGKDTIQGLTENAKNTLKEFDTKWERSAST